MSNLIKWSCIVGSLLLLCMGLFHGSGFNWISGEITQSNIAPVLKGIFPVLFIHVSIQLIGLAILGASLVFFQNGIRVIASFITIMVAANVGLAFWLGAFIPGIALSCAAICFGFVAAQPEEQVVSKADS
ncbi:hypothetical protein [Microbulbifer discodermiae]|uniref:hypothetical protein n=1 Tax=Microbulbifer sp. 2201CG32-9 TaxID=3232309 RepID=UPI00345BBDFE